MGLKAAHCRVNLAGLGECSTQCQRCQREFEPGQAIVIMAKATWIARHGFRKAGAIRDTQLIHAVCPEV